VGGLGAHPSLRVSPRDERPPRSQPRGRAGDASCLMVLERGFAFTAEHSTAGVFSSIRLHGRRLLRLEAELFRPRSVEFNLGPRCGCRWGQQGKTELFEPRQFLNV